MNSNALSIKAIIACDDLRIENNGKYLLIGTYGPQIFVPSYPFNMTISLVAVVDFCNIGECAFQFRVVQNKTNVLFSFQGAAQIVTPEKGAILPLGKGPLVFSSDSCFGVESMVGESWKLLQEWTVRIGPPPKPTQ